MFLIDTGTSFCFIFFALFVVPGWCRSYMKQKIYILENTTWYFHSPLFFSPGDPLTMEGVKVFVSSAVVFPEETCPAVIQVKDGRIHHITRHSTDVSAFPSHQVYSARTVQQDQGFPNVGSRSLWGREAIARGSQIGLKVAWYNIDFSSSIRFSVFAHILCFCFSAERKKTQ